MRPQKKSDLFLDTLPYGAHTTAADALWMGVPVFTLRGNSFPSRICASVVSAAGLENMICSSPDEYIATAVSFGQNPQLLMPFKEKLIAGRDSCLLFDTPRLVGHLEEIYHQMWREFEQGLLPIPDLTNLDIYHEIGLDLDIENIDMLSESAYHALYRQKLSDRNSYCPIRGDGRLWPTEPRPDNLFTRAARTHTL
jgi:Glycosyl transferase family 41